MSSPLPRPSRRGLLALPALLAGLSLTGCGQGGSSATAGGDTALSLADADILSDPTSYEGPSTAHLAQHGVRAVEKNPTPAMPATIKDAQGTKVTVKDVSRILAIDLYGSTSRIVYDLGLGDNVVGRDISSQFAEIKDKPMVTEHGHELNGESIHEAAPEGAEKLRVMFFCARGQSGTFYIFGEGSGADDLISGLGALDVAKEIGWDGMKPMTDEAIIDANPDVLLMMTKGLESCGGVDGLLESIPAIAMTPAGQKHRVVDMEDTDILAFGPVTAGILEALALAVYAPESTKSAA